MKDDGDDSVADLKGLRVRDIKSWDDFELTYWWLKKNPEAYKTLIVDTMTQLQQLTILKVLRDKDLKGKQAGDWGTMRKQDWGEVASLMKTWITHLRDLPMEVVFIAQDRAFNVGGEEDPDVQLDPEVGPALSPSIAKHLNAAVHVIGNTFIRRRTKVIKVEGKKKEIQKIQFCLRVGPNEVYITKVRKPKHVQPPSVIVDPTYEDLINLVKGVTE